MNLLDQIVIKTQFVGFIIVLIGAAFIISREVYYKVKG
jgi:hypothetical protein